MTSNEDRPTQTRSCGITLRFGYPSDNSVAVRYTRFWLFESGWVEGHERRTLVLTFNDQCIVPDVVMELKRAADALGIFFGDAPTLTVEQPDVPPAGHNWRHLAEDSAKRLGWELNHPFGPRIEAPPFAFDDTCDAGF